MRRHSVSRRITPFTACLLVPVLTVAAGLALISRPSVNAQGTPAAIGQVAFPVAIHEGTCDQPVAEPKFQVGDAVPYGLNGEDDAQAEEVRGIPPEAPVLRAQGTIDATFDDLLDSPHVVAVHQSAEEFGAIIACGNLGGIVDDGKLAVALRPATESGPTGVAILDEDREGILGIGENQVHVTVYLVTAPGGPAVAGTPQAMAGNVIDVALTEYAIAMPSTVPAGQVSFRVTNNGTMEHNFEIEGQGIEKAFDDNLQPGETGEMVVDLQPGTYEVYCPVDDHADRGMRIELTVTG